MIGAEGGTATPVAGGKVALVTGASGFVGRAVVEGLRRDGWTVRALLRRPDPALPPEVVSCLAADITDREAIRRALTGVHAVVHLAARVHVMHDTASDRLAAFRAVNVDGMRVVAEEAAQAGVETVLLASSVKTVAERSERTIDETVVPAPVDPYGVSKLEAEGVLRACGERAGMRTPILRLPLVYGPGVRANMRQLFWAVERGIPLPLGRVRNQRSLLFVGNLVHGIQCALATPAARGTYFITDQDDLSTPALIRLIAQALGRPARLVGVPPAALRAAAAMAGAAPWPDALSRVGAIVHRLVESLAFDSTLLTRTTGYQPPYSVLDGLRATAHWYQTTTA